MRHSWFIAVTDEPEAIGRRVAVNRKMVVRAIADGRTIVVATTPDVVVRENEGRITIDPIRNVTIASIDATTGQVQASRALLSVPEVYWTDSGDSLLLAGSLAELLPHLGSRRLLERSIVDHHIFRWSSGTRTYLEGVFHLLPGHELQWNGQGSATTRQIQSLREFISEERRPVNRTSASLQIEALRRAMARHLEYTRGEDRAVLLSGGIDSSVMQMVIEGLDKTSRLQTRSFILDTPEWLEEEGYCREAVAIFHTQHEYIRISPADYPGLLVDSIAMLGRPFGHDSQPASTGLFRALGASGPTTLWSGEGADAIYGRTTIKPRYGHLPQPILWALGIALQPFSPTKAQNARTTAQRMQAYLGGDTRPEHPMNTQARYCDLDTVTRWFGERAVEEAMTERRSLATLMAGPLSDIERVHVLSLFTSALYSASMDFQFAAAMGCTVLNPYIDERVIRAVLRIDPEQRYFYKGRTKPLLKLALQERTGRDFIARPKRGGGFYTDLCQWMRKGVLADMVRSIERPSYVDLKNFQQKLETPDWTTWDLLLMDLYAKHLRSVVAKNTALELAA
jgi:asparagine synthetase B (glutamine-hydrolysing)